MGVDKIILSNPDLYYKALDIGISVDEMMAEINAFDWLYLRESPGIVYFDIQKRLKFKPQKGKLKEITEMAFSYKFKRAIENLSAIVEEVNSSYNIPNAKGLNNDEINKYYYLKYWADKKSIPVDYNESDQAKKKMFNFYTILFDIFANKLDNFNHNASIKKN